jgi:hypothetical protein
MKTVIKLVFAFLSTLFRSRATLRLEIVALRHQLTVYQRTIPRPRIQTSRPTLLVLALALLVGLAKRTGVCAARDCDCPAAETLS